MGGKSGRNARGKENSRRELENELRNFWKKRERGDGGERGRRSKCGEKWYDDDDDDVDDDADDDDADDDDDDGDNSFSSHTRQQFQSKARAHTPSRVNPSRINYKGQENAVTTEVFARASVTTEYWELAP